MDQINNILPIVSNVIFNYHIIDILIFVLLVGGFCLGLIKKTWYNVTHLCVFFTLFLIGWFALTPILDSFVGNDLLKLIKPDGISYNKTLSFSTSVNSLSGMDISTLGIPVLNDKVTLKDGTFEISVTFNFQANSIKELFGQLISVSPFVSAEDRMYFLATGTPKDECAQIVNIMINSITWGLFIIVLFIATQIISGFLYLILKHSLFKNIRKKWDSRLLGGILGLVVPGFCVFVSFQALGVWAGTIDFLKDAFSTVLKSTQNAVQSAFADSSAANIEGFSSLSTSLQPLFDFLEKVTEPRQVSICFGWMAGNGNIFGTIEKGGQILQAGDAVKFYFEAILGGTGEGSILNDLNKGESNVKDILKYLQLLNAQNGGDNLGLSINMKTNVTVNIGINDGELGNLLSTYSQDLSPETIEALKGYGFNIGEMQQQVASGTLDNAGFAGKVQDLVSTMASNCANKMADAIIQGFKQDDLSWLSTINF